MSGDAILVGRSLTQTFGVFTAVEGVDVTVAPGEVVGLLGANGAGKTTLIRMLLGLLPPTSGEVTLLGATPSRRTRSGVGYVPQHLGLYADLTVGANRSFQHDVYGVAAGAAGAVDGVADDSLVGDLSLGQQRRLAFRLALDHDPALLVLDEPTSGVGPLGRARLWDEIHAAADAGRGVLVTTHYLAEAEQCHRLIVMAAGRVVATGTVEEIVGDAHAVVVSGTPVGPVLGVLQDAGMLGALAAGGVAVPGDDVAAVEAVLAASSLAGGTRVHVRPATLEERFVELAAIMGANGGGV